MKKEIKKFLELYDMDKATQMNLKSNSYDSTTTYYRSPIHWRRKL